MGIISQSRQADYALAQQPIRHQRPLNAKALYRERRPAHVSPDVWDDLYDAIVASVAMKLVDEFVQAHAGREAA